MISTGRFSVRELVLAVGSVVATAGPILGAPYQRDELTPLYRQAAQYILNQEACPKTGYCMVFGAGQGRLAWELSELGDFKVLGAEEDSAAVDAGRAVLHRADVYGDRITLHRQSLQKLDYRNYAATLVVSDAMIAHGRCPGSADEMYRMVRPDGGIAILGQPPGCPKKLTRQALQGWLDMAGLNYRITESARDGLWATVRRGPLPGAGQWTHVRADLGNTACSGDSFVGERFRVLWFGRPGPALMVDRHWRGTSPLYKDGRLVIPGQDRVICVDAYNGAVTWQLNISNASRIAMMRDAGWLVLGGHDVYAAAENKCMKIDASSGEIRDTFGTPDPRLDWGYVGVEGDRLYGSQQIHQASYLASNMGRGGTTMELGRGDRQPIVTSKAMFCRNRHDGELQWTYPADSAVVANATICGGGQGLYFFESTSSSATANTVGRVTLADFTEGPSEFLVKLDSRTGKPLWRRQFDMPVQHVLHLCYANGMLLASGTGTSEKDYWYYLRAFRAQDGSLVWERDVASGFGTWDARHGQQDKHPMIIGNAVYLRHGNFDLATGRPLGFAFETTNCAECSASAYYVFGRNNGVASTWSLTSGSTWALSPTMRPGCYTSIIPAGGIVTMPAFGAGCTCSHSLQTTIGWLPENRTPDEPSNK